MKKIAFLVLLFGVGISAVATYLALRPAVQEGGALYKEKTFNLSGSFLSPKQIEEHLKLYKGYVTRRNEIAQKLAQVEKTGNTTYAPYRALKIAETYARNGQLLHELYFEQLEESAEMGERLKGLLVQSFGSLDNFFADLKASALSARGWVLTGYDESDGHVHNFVLEAHNETVPVMVLPLLVTDVYEHAYFIDFGTDRTKYFDLYLKALNWAVVERRAMAVLPA